MSKRLIAQIDTGKGGHTNSFPRYSLPEVRVLYELYHHENLTAGDIVAFIGIDKGYLSRILRQFENKKLILKERSDKDGRSTRLSLTRAGVVEFELLNKASHDRIREILDSLTEEECDKLVRNMAEIKMILSKTGEFQFLRPPFSICERSLARPLLFGPFGFCLPGL